MASTFTNGTATATSASDLNALITEADKLTAVEADQQNSSGILTIDISGLIALNTLPAVSDGESLSWSGFTSTVVTDTAIPDIAAVNLQSGVKLVITGSNNAVLDGGNTVRGLFAYAGNLTVNNLTIQNTVAQGGAGANAGFAGGGGAGLGGGLFVGTGANVTLNSVSFSGNQAIGGAGGNNMGGSAAGSWGGGGGLGGAGGFVDGELYISGGGGVGRTAFGGAGSYKAVTTYGHTDDTSNPGPGIIVGGASGGNGAPFGYTIGGSAAANAPHTTGAKYGGGGGISHGTNSAGPPYFGGGAGGGGVGGHAGYSRVSGYNSKDNTGGGGVGGFGGGGGAGYYYGGSGGFGGGGGAGQYRYGGNGGFGGGGGGLPDTKTGSSGLGKYGLGGFGAGNAGGGYNVGNYGTSGSGVAESAFPQSGGDSGGGGLGAGGAVFVQSGGVLTLGAGSLSNGTVTGGAGGVATEDNVVITSKTQVIDGLTENGFNTDGTAGTAFGSAIFIQNDSTSVVQGVTLAPGSGQTLSVSGVIADEKGSGGTLTNATAGELMIQGGGKVTLGADNTYTGTTTISAGDTLELSKSDSAGTIGVIVFGGGADTLQLDATTMPTNTISGYAAGDVIDLRGLAFATGATAIYNSTTHILSVTSNGVSKQLTLTNPTTSTFTAVSDGAMGTAGTEITSNPTISSAVYDASSGHLTVSGTALTTSAGDYSATAMTLTGQDGTTYTLTGGTIEANPTSTTFVVDLTIADQLAVDGLLNADGTSSVGATTYNLAATSSFDTGGNADTTSAVTVSNALAPSISAVAFNYTTGVLTLIGTSFENEGSTGGLRLGDITLKGQGGSTHTLSAANAAVTSESSATVTLTGSNLTNVRALFNATGTSSADGTTYNFAATAGWDSDAGAAITTEGVTVSSVPPPSGTDGTVTTPENTAYTFTAADFGFSDPSGSTLSAVEITTLPGAGTLTDNGLALTAGNFISIADINSGKLVFTPATNADGADYASFTFQVQDSGGDTDPTPKTITVDVTPQPPSGASGTVTTLENTAYTFTAADFGFSDINGSTLAAVEITTLPGAGTLTDNGVAVTAGNLISIADVNSGKLVFTPATNADGAGYASFTFQVEDSGGDTDPTPKTLTVNVTPGPPSGTDGTVTTPENTAYTFTAADFGFSDVNGSTLSAVEITTLPGAGTLTDNGVALTAGNFISIADINSGKLIFTPATNADGAGYASFTFQVQDSGGDTDPTPKTITVDVTQQPPSGASGTITTPENTAYTFTAADFGFSDINGTTLSAVEITTLPGAGTLTDNGVAVTAGNFVSVSDINAGKLVFTPATNADGATYASFTFQVQDSSGTTDPAAKTITVNVTPGPPSGTDGTVTTPENTAYTFTAADFGFSDPGGSTLAAVEITTLPSAGTLTDNGLALTAGNFISIADINSGKLVFTPATNADGAGYASFTFQVEDANSLTDPTPKTITVDVTQQPPSGASGTVTTLENTAYTFTVADFGFSDINGSTLSAVEITTLPVAGTLTDNGVAVSAGNLISIADVNSGKLVFTPATNASGAGYASFTFQVKDSGGDTDPTPKSLTVNITQINEAPSGTDKTIVTNENGSSTLTVADFGFTDPNNTPPNNLLAVEITTTPTAGSLTDNGVSVTPGQLISVADISGNKLVFTPAAGGFGDNYASLTFQVEDDGGTANGGMNIDPTPKTLTFDVDSTEKMYFSAVGTGNTGPDLYQLPEDSTPQAIPVRTDANASFGSFAGEDGGFHALDGNLYFLANTAGTFDALFQLSPTGSLTELTGATGVSGQDANFTEFDGSLYFTGLTSDGEELVRLDPNGTLTTIDVNPGAANSFAGQTGFGVFDGSLYFSADTPNTGTDLFKLAAGSTTPVAVEVDPGTMSSNAGEDGGFIVFNNTLYFNADDASGSEALFNLASGSTTPTEVKDPNGVVVTHTFEIPSSFFQFGNKLYFDAVDNATLEDTLETINSSGVATPIHYQGQDLAGAGQFGGFTAFDGDLYFTATTASTNTDLFKIDSAGNVTALNLTQSGSFSAFDGNLTTNNFIVFDSSLYFDAYNAGGDALYTLAAGSTTPTVVLDSGTTQAGTDGGFRIFDGSLYFSAYTSNGYDLVELDTNGTLTDYQLNLGPPNTNSFAGANGGFVVFPPIVPTVVAETGTVVAGQTVTGSGGPGGTGALAGDSDANADPLSISAVAGLAGNVGKSTAGNYGELTLNTDGSYSYVANQTAAINGAASGSKPVDIFTYTVSDGQGGTANETLSFTVDRSPATATHTVSVHEGASTGTASAGDSDPDGDSVTVTALAGGTLGTADAGTYGSLTLNANDTYSYTANNTAAINAAPPGSALTDSFTYTVSDGHGGTATETLSFAINRTSVPSDFSGDGMSDVFWRQSNGTLAEWLMNGSTITSSPAPTSLGRVVTPDTTWSIAGFGDFDGNGTTDILWRQSGTGVLPIWSMNGSVITSNEITYQGQTVRPDSSWNVAGIGDFNGDGDADILWRQGSTNTLADWSMNGATITSSQAPTFQGQAIMPDSSWSVAGIGDFNGDGKSDILWRQSSTGAVVDWSMNGATITSSQNLTSQGHAITPDASWSVAGVGDFNGDGDADLLWRQGSTGTLAMWLMNGSQITSSQTPTYQGNAISPDSSWNVVEVGDFNGDGKSDVLWQQSSTGTLAEWQMNGSQIVSSLTLTSQGTAVAPGSTWQVEEKPTNLA